MEDDPSLREPLAEALSDAGFEVLCAWDGPGALARQAAEDPDLVLLDLGLPGMDGLEVCKRLKAQAGERHLPVLFVTASSDVETLVRLLESGGDDFCPKPFRFEALLARIGVLLRARERQLELERRSAELLREALVDPLTGLGNRRAFEEHLEREWARARRGGHGLGLLVCDVDRFKAVNDRHGHPAGDRALRAVAAAIAGAVRGGDEAFRCGGEEFAVVVPEATRETSLAVANRVRDRVAALRLDTGPVTVSIGVGVASGPSERAGEELFGRVDRALYAAKATGRDRVVLVMPPSEVTLPRDPDDDGTRTRRA